MANFSDTFFAEGPGSVGANLEKGLELLKDFKKEFSVHESQRVELANAEKLFDLDVTPYPNLNKVKNELEGLTMIYDLYARQVETRDEWA